MLLWFILANRVDVFCSDVINILGYVCQLRHHITFPSKGFMKLKNLHGYHLCLSFFLWLGISDLIICRIFMNSAEEFWQKVVKEACIL